MTMLICHECLRKNGRRSIAFVTVHDKNGCMHLCWSHAKQKENDPTVQIGHSVDCAEARYRGW